MNFWQKTAKKFRPVYLFFIVIIILIILSIRTSISKNTNSKSAFGFYHINHSDISCGFCHGGVSYASEIKIPTKEECLNCHNWMSDRGNVTQKYVPGFKNHANFASIYPAHYQHFKVKLECSTCHGGVQGEKRVKSNVDMNFCIDCHKERQSLSNSTAPSLDCKGCHR